MSTTTNVSTAGGTWTVDAPDGVTVIPPADPAGSLKITIDYGLDALFGQSHGIIDLTFNEPAGGPPGGVDNFGLRFPYVFEFRNSLGLPVDGFVLFNADETSVVDPDIGPGGHPQKYAHFHGVTATTFSPLTTSVHLQDNATNADFGGPDPTLKAPGQIQAEGPIADGGSVTGSPIVLHQWDQAGINDSFHIALFPLLTSGQIMVTAASGEVSHEEGTGTDTTYTFTINRLGDGGAIDATSTTVEYDVVGQGADPIDGADFVGGSAPQGTVTFAPDENSKTISFTVAGDSTQEENETFRVELSNPSGTEVIVTHGEATGTIVNDDVTPLPVIKNLTDGNDFWPGPGFPGDTNGGAEIINGNAGNDTLSGGAGDDTIDGGPGSDTATWASYRLQNSISIHPETDASLSGPEGNDTVRNVERYVLADGEFITDTVHEAAQVYRLYGAALDRTPDQTGLKTWTDALTSHMATLTEVAQEFTESPEFTSRYGNLDNEGFITLLYQNVLDRDPDAAGLESWENSLINGLSRAEALVGFSESPENVDRTRDDIEHGLWLRDDQAAIIARLYDTVLDRLPDADGLSSWKGGLQSGMTLEQVADGFTLSPEFISRYGSLDDTQFIMQLYRNVLAREGEDAGVQAWKNGIDNGLSRSEVVLGFSELPEHQTKLADSIDYGIVLG